VSWRVQLERNINHPTNQLQERNSYTHYRGIIRRRCMPLQLLSPTLQQDPETRELWRWAHTRQGGWPPALVSVLTGCCGRATAVCIAQACRAPCPSLPRQASRRLAR
jgi:hypothetical protein